MIGSKQNYSMPSYKLIYFDVPGRGELARLLFHYGGIKFEDERITSEQWPALKQEFQFGQVPVLEIDGEQFAQSVAISRYVANEVELAGNNNLENLKIDGVIDVMGDFLTQVTACIKEKDETKKKALQDDIVNKTAPTILGKLDALAKSNGGFLALNRLTWADFGFVALLENVTNFLQKDVFASYPNLQKIKKHVLGIPNIREYLKNRPSGNNPFMPKFYSLTQDL